MEQKCPAYGGKAITPRETCESHPSAGGLDLDCADAELPGLVVSRLATVLLDKGKSLR